MATRKELEAPPLEGDLALERMFQENSSHPEEEEEEEDDEKMRCVLPLFCDTWEEASTAVAARSEAAAERRRREAEEKAREAEEEKRRAEERKRLKDEAVWRRKKHEAVSNSTICIPFIRF
jgi:dTMP kinase